MFAVFDHGVYGARHLSRDCGVSLAAQMGIVSTFGNVVFELVEEAAPKGACRKPGAVRLSSPSHPATARRLAREPQTPVSAILRIGFVDPSSQPKTAACLSGSLRPIRG